jgi:hypothetical protein
MTRTPTVRLALDCDGEAVRKLVQKQHGALDTLQWDRIAPYWLVAEIGGVIVGALQTCPSRPIGRLEMLSLARDLCPRAKAVTVKALAMAGMSVILGHGAQQVQMFVPEDLTEYRAILESRGAVVLDTGHMLAKRLV